MQSVIGIRKLAKTQVRIQDLVKGGPASEAKSCQCSKAESHKRSEQSVARLSGPWKLFGCLMLKYAFSHILETLFL